MAAPGPPQLPWLRLGPRLRSGLEVALRVPSLFLIDAIFNSAPLPGGSVCAALLGVLLRLLGETPSGPGGALGAAPGGPGRAGPRPRCSLGSPPPRSRTAGLVRSCCASSGSPQPLPPALTPSRCLLSAAPGSSLGARPAVAVCSPFFCRPERCLSPWPLSVSHTHPCPRAFGVRPQLRGSDGLCRAFCCPRSELGLGSHPSSV